MVYFTDDSEIQASHLGDTEELPEEKHIVGQVFMLWPVINNCKLQLKTGSDTLDIVFEGPGIEKLDFIAKDIVRIGLRGARKETKKSSSSMALPFKLVFSKGAIVQLLASQRREKDKFVDLFKDIEENKRRTEDEWFYPPPAVDHSPKVDPSVQVSHPFSEQNNPEYNAHIPESTAKDKLPQDSGDNEAQLQFQHSLDRVWRGDLRSADESSLHTTLQSNEPSVSSVPAAAVLLPSPQAAPKQARRRKDKRVKKRDTRHVQNSTGSAASNTTLRIGKNPIGKNAQNHPGKKLKRRAAKFTQAEAANAAIEHPPTPPPRDPALDLVAGFHSDKGGQYTPIDHITPGVTCSVVGIVLDVGATRTTRTGELSKSFALVDPSKCDGSGITVNIFASQSDEELLPSARWGQVLLLRNVKVKEFWGKPQGICYKDSFKWCGYDPVQGKHFYTITNTPSSSLGSSAMGSNSDPFFKVTAAELGYFVKISDWWRALKELESREHSVINDNQGAGNIHVVTQRRSHRRMATISEIEVGVFVDCVVELVGVRKNDINTTIFVTDYSENENLYDHVEANDHPIGRRTLTVTLWDGPHTMADDLEVNNYYLLENILIKMGHGGYVEGSIGYQDTGVRKIGSGSTQKNLAELLSRKKAYQENPHYSYIRCDEEYRRLVPEPMQHGHDVTDEGSSVSRRNGVLECLHMEQKCSSIEELLNCAMCPNRFRIRARVVEYYPRYIGDFVKVECNACGKILDAGYHLCPDCGELSESSTTVRYQFAIHVADRSGELNISVSDKEADELLIGLSARDARDDPEALKMRLSPLLGHLDKWHRELDDIPKKEPGPWLDMCVYSWISEGSETVRVHRLFGCHLGGEE